MHQSVEVAQQEQRVSLIKGRPFWVKQSRKNTLDTMFLRLSIFAYKQSSFQMTVTSEYYLEVDCYRVLRLAAMSLKVPPDPPDPSKKTSENGKTENSGLSS